MASNELMPLLTRLRKDTALLDSEEATKQGIILPILSRIGWDRDNIREVIPEYRIGSGRVDYCLHAMGKNAVFIEAKRTDQDLDRHQEQLLDYAFREGVEIAALTNGRLWWLYLPLLQGSWEQRKFFTIDIVNQDPADVAEHFDIYLSRAEVTTGGAVKKAKSLHESRAKQRLTLKTLPRAWAQLLEGPDELLSELLAERVEGLCGHRPSPDQIAGFLANQPTGSIRGETSQAPPLTTSSSHRQEQQPRRSQTVSNDGSFTFRKPTGFKFRGKVEMVSSWKGVLVGLCRMVAKEHPAEFERVLQLRGRKRAYFSRDPRGMTAPGSIPGTAFFVETNLSANSVAKRCEEVVQLFGYEKSVFEITAREALRSQ